jgi:hypothetical protein
VSIITIQPTDSVANSRAVINANFESLAAAIGSGGSDFLSGATTLNFPSIPRGESKVLSFTATGAIIGGVAFVGPPAAWDDEVLFCAKISAANTIKIVVSNQRADGTEYDPSAGDWAWRVMSPLSTLLSGSAPLNFPSIPSGQSAVLSITASGAVAGATAAVGPPAGWDDEVSFCARVSALDTIKVIVMNNKADGTEYDPGSGTWTWVVL